MSVTSAVRMDGRQIGVKGTKSSPTTARGDWTWFTLTVPAGMRSSCTRTPAALSPSSRNGRLTANVLFLLHLASTGQEDIFTVRADGTDLRQVTKTPDREEFADWGMPSD